MVPLGADQGQHLLIHQEGGPGPEDLAEPPISFSNSHMDVCGGLDTWKNGDVFLGRCRGILVPQQGVKPTFPALEAQSLNHCITREVPEWRFLERIVPLPLS